MDGFVQPVEAPYEKGAMNQRGYVPALPFGGDPDGD
jgi:hypothetical protein